jgi:hypothetical protein
MADRFLGTWGAAVLRPYKFGGERKGLVIGNWHSKADKWLHLADMGRSVLRPYMIVTELRRILVYFAGGVSTICSVVRSK